MSSWAENNFAIIVASGHARSGKTLLARLLAENFVQGGMQPAIFDTDAAAPLVSRFPNDVFALDMSASPTRWRCSMGFRAGPNPKSST